MVEFHRENAPKSFKCNRCGVMFEISSGDTQKCPACGKICTAEECNIMESSDEDY